MSTVFDVWMAGAWQEVVGESFYEQALQRIVRSTDDDAIIIPVHVVHTPNNKWDKNAVAIMSEHGQIGSLPKGDAARYAPRMAMLQARGITLRAHARVWGYDSIDYDGTMTFRASVTVELPPPHLLYPLNEPPTDAYVLLPRGGAIQVTGEEEHTDFLSNFCVQEGEGWVFATLSPGTSKTGKPAMEVRIDSQQVGRLSPKMTADLLPACQHLLDHGKTPTVRALVKGNRLRMEVVLYPARAFELTNEWVERVTEPEPVTEVPVTVQPVAEAPAPSEPDETAPPVPAAAWFDDPWGQARLRWWDGKEWTGHTYD